MVCGTEEKDEELMKLREEVGEISGLKEKLARWASLKESLIKTEEWRIRTEGQLKASIEHLDKATSLFA